MKTRLALHAALAALAIYDIAYIGIWLSHRPQPPFGDFFGLWSFGRAAASGVPVYDPLALQALQHRLMPTLHGEYPYPYPPLFLALLVPLGLLPLAMSYVVWIGATFACYAVAVVEREWRSVYGVALLVAPTTLLTVVSGQNGLLSAALLVGALRLMDRRPVVSGVLFGLLAYKPQLGLLVPIVLLASRNWRGLAATVASLAAMAVASSAALGWNIWPEWVAAIPMHQQLFWANHATLDHLMPTVAAGVRELGGSPLLADMAQGVLACAAASVVWRLFSRGATQTGIATALVGTVLVTPYVFTYDLPIVTAGLIIEAQRRQREGIGTSLPEVAVVVLAYAAIVDMSNGTLPLVAPALLAAMFARLAWNAGIGRRAVRDDPRRVLTPGFS